MGASSKYFPRIETYFVPGDLFRTTLTALRREGRDLVESTAYWAGSVSDDTAAITTLIVPIGPGVRMHRLQVRVSDRVVAAIDAMLDPPYRVLLAQVHTHAGEAFHSAVDDAYGIDTFGFISVVVPEFGRGDLAALHRWSFNECVEPGRYRELSRAETASRFITSTRTTEVIQVHGH